MDTTQTRTNLFGLDRQGLRDWFAQAGEKPYRADQVMKWMYHRCVTDFSQMTDVGKALRGKLESIAEIVPPHILFEKQSTDGTYKWLLGMDARNAIEAVFIPESTRGTLCVSSQVGCGLNCQFCSTATRDSTATSHRRDHASLGGGTAIRQVPHPSAADKWS